MDITKVILLGLFLITIKNPIKKIKELAQKTREHFLQIKLKKKRINDLLVEVTRNLQEMNFHPLEHVGVANGIASPTPSLSNGRRYKGDTISFIKTYNPEAPMSFICTKVNFLIWKKNGKWQYTDNIERVRTVLNSQESRAAQKLYVTASECVSDDFEKSLKEYKRKKQSCREKINKTRKLSSRVAVELR